MTRPADQRYTLTAIGLHWLLAALLIATFAVGATMTELPMSPARLRTFNWHKWAGATVLALTLARIAWRLAHPPPASLPMARWQARVALANHVLLLALCVVVPLLGWAYSSASGFPLVWLGVLPLPDFVAADKSLAESLKPWHGRAAWLLAALVALHLAGVASHLARDGLAIVYRMLPFGR